MQVAYSTEDPSHINRVYVIRRLLCANRLRVDELKAGMNKGKL